MQGQAEHKPMCKVRLGIQLPKFPKSQKMPNYFSLEKIWQPMQYDINNN